MSQIVIISAEIVVAAPTRKRNPYIFFFDSRHSENASPVREAMNIAVIPIFSWVDVIKLKSAITIYAAMNAVLPNTDPKILPAFCAFVDAQNPLLPRFFQNFSFIHSRKLSFRNAKFCWWEYHNMTQYTCQHVWRSFPGKWDERTPTALQNGTSPDCVAHND